LNDWESSPESVKGDGPGAELVRAIRKIDQVRRRLDVIALEISSLTRSDLYQLRNEVLEADRKGRDLLGEMAEQVDRDIEAAAQRLAATPSGDHGS
jgi:hypothetical protein